MSKKYAIGWKFPNDPTGHRGPFFTDDKDYAQCIINDSKSTCPDVEYWVEERKETPEE